jgi:hypothetical protein
MASHPPSRDLKQAVTRLRPRAKQRRPKNQMRQDERAASAVVTQNTHWICRRGTTKREGGPPTDEMMMMTC